MTNVLAVCVVVIREDLLQVFVYLEYTTLCVFFEEEVKTTDEIMEFVRADVVLVREFVVKLFRIVTDEGTTNELGETVMVAA